MARPKKEGLDYFPLDVDIDQDDKIALVEAKHGLEGFAVVIKLFMKIYKNSYFYNWTEKEQLLFSKRINVDINSLNVIVMDCIEWDLFDKAVFDQHGVLTSSGIQSRYLEAIGRRKELFLNRDYLLVTPSEHLGNSKIKVIYVNSDGNRVNVDINSINEDINPQSKVKERKVKESIIIIDDSETQKSDDDGFSDKPNLFKEYEKHFGPFPMGAFLNQINDWIDNSQFQEPEAIICEVIKRAKLNTPKNPPKYIQSILVSLEGLGLFTLKAVQDYNEKHDQKVKQLQEPKKSIHNLSLVRPAHWKEPEPLTEEEYKRIEEDCAGLI